MSIDTMLKDDQIRPKLSDQGRNELSEERSKRFVTGSRWKGNVDLAPRPISLSGFIWEVRARKQASTVLVEVDIQDSPVVIESVHYAIAVVCVNIDIGDLPSPRIVIEPTRDRNGEVVVDAETARSIRVRVMESAGGVERTKGTSGLYSSDALDHPSDDPRGGRIAPGKGGSVPLIERHTRRSFGQSLNQVDIFSGVKQLNFPTGRGLDFSNPGCQPFGRFP
jgi:hypothetical protein